MVAGEQPLQLSDRILLDAFIGHEANVHPAALYLATQLRTLISTSEPTPTTSVTN